MPQLLIIGYIWPEPDSSAAGARMMQLIDFFLKRNYQISFATTAARSEFAVDLEELGIQTENIKLNDSRFDDFIKEIQPELVLFDRYMMEEQFGWRVAEFCPDAIRILDTEDLHFLRKTRETAFKKDLPPEDLLFSSDLTKREIASIYRSDLSLIISEAEMTLLKTRFKIDESLVQYLPFLLDEISSEEIKSLPIFEDRRHFVSIGNFLHEPNWNAVLHLKEKIWPLIRRKLPQAEIHIYGGYPSQKVWNLHSPDTGFMVKGRAENAEMIMQQARVCLAPIQFGAGLKGKLIKAMQNGTPSVTTSIGAEGIAGSMSWNGLIENEPSAFAEAAAHLYNNQKIWEKSRDQGFEIINTRFVKNAFQEVFAQRIEKLKLGLPQHRAKNFIGAMLQHHQHKSTYYMSKYIELKNKNN